MPGRLDNEDEYFESNFDGGEGSQAEEDNNDMGIFI